MLKLLVDEQLEERCYHSPDAGNLAHTCGESERGLYRIGDLLKVGVRSKIKPSMHSYNKLICYDESSFFIKQFCNVLFRSLDLSSQDKMLCKFLPGNVIVSFSFEG